MDKKVSAGQLRKQLDLMDQKDMTSDRFQQLLDTGILADIFDPAANFDREVLRSALKLGTLAPDIFRLTVDYGQSLEQMISDGKYEWKNSDITSKHFQVKGDGVVEFEAHYFYFNGVISSDDAIKGIEAVDTTNPWSPAKIEHMLSHGKTFPEEQRKFPVIGLGSVARVDGDRYVPELYKDYSRRSLDLRWFGGDWDPVYRFLAIRKIKSV